jgi:hypothetical protein
METAERLINGLISGVVTHDPDMMLGLTCVLFGIYALQYIKSAGWPASRLVKRWRDRRKLLVR